MTLCARICVLLCLFAGCKGTSQKFDNPVVGPPPPRVKAPGVAVAGQEPAKVAIKSNGDESAAAEQGLEQTEYRVPDPAAKSADPSAKSDQPTLPGDIAARVNGNPIFVAEVLQPYAAQLETFRKSPQISPEEFERMRRQLVKRDLPFYIETAMVVDEVLNKMDADQKASVNKQLDKIFEEQLSAAVKKAGVQSVPELEAQLKENGSSLANELQMSGDTVAELRKSFGNRALSAQFLREEIGTISPPTRLELLDEYHRQEDKYSHPARVKWQQLQVSFAAHRGPENARRALGKARAELQAGQSFDEVVKKHGDGPLAALGGHFDWTQPDSVADAGLKEALKTLKPGQVSLPIESDKACMVIKVTESEPARTTPFEDVQEELRKAVEKRKHEERVAAVVAGIRAKAVVETMFDNDPEPLERQVSPVSSGGGPSS